MVASLPLTTSTRLPERSVTLPNLLSPLSLSSLLSLSSPLADFVPLPWFVRQTARKSPPWVIKATDDNLVWSGFDAIIAAPPSQPTRSVSA